MSFLLFLGVYLSILFLLMSFVFLMILVTLTMICSLLFSLCCIVLSSSYVFLSSHHIDEFGNRDDDISSSHARSHAPSSWMQDDDGDDTQRSPSKNR